MNSKELYKFTNKLFDECASLLLKKSSDYANTETNVFKNLSMIEHYGVGTTQVAIFTKLSDKLSRLATYINKGEFKVNDESLKNTVEDLINYSALFLAYIESKEKK